MPCNKHSYEYIAVPPDDGNATRPLGIEVCMNHSPAINLFDEVVIVENINGLERGIVAVVFGNSDTQGKIAYAVRPEGCETLVMVPSTHVCPTGRTFKHEDFYASVPAPSSSPAKAEGRKSEGDKTPRQARRGIRRKIRPSSRSESKHGDAPRYKGRYEFRITGDQSLIETLGTEAVGVSVACRKSPEGRWEYYLLLRGTAMRVWVKEEHLSPTGLKMPSFLETATWARYRGEQSGGTGGTAM